MKRTINFYLGHFALWYVGLSILVALISAFVYDVGGAVRLFIAFVASTTVASMFVKTERRAPSDDEQRKLIFGSLFIWAALNLVVGVALYFTGGLLQDIDATSGTLLAVLVFVFSLLAAVTLLFLYLSYSFIARKQAEKLNVKR
ncbi:MAG: ABZJ_00895 family protein [Pseudomonadota bacterium]